MNKWYLNYNFVFHVSENFPYFVREVEIEVKIAENPHLQHQQRPAIKLFRDHWESKDIASDYVCKTSARALAGRRQILYSSSWSSKICTTHQYDLRTCPHLALQFGGRATFIKKIVFVNTCFGTCGFRWTIPSIGNFMVFFRWAKFHTLGARSLGWTYNKLEITTQYDKEKQCSQCHDQS